MSATINIQLFKDYFQGEAPVIQVTGQPYSKIKKIKKFYQTICKEKIFTIYYLVPKVAVS